MKSIHALLGLLLLLVACQAEPCIRTVPDSLKRDSLGKDSLAQPLWDIDYTFQQVVAWPTGPKLYIAEYGQSLPQYLLFFEQQQSSIQRFHTGSLLGKLTRAELVDLDKDQQPELLLYTQKDKHKFLALIALQADGQKIGEWQLPYLDDSQNEVFSGEGYFSVEDSLLVHHFVSTSNGDSLHLHYSYHNGNLEALDYAADEEHEK